MHLFIQVSSSVFFPTEIFIHKTKSCCTEPLTTEVEVKNLKWQKTICICLLKQLKGEIAQISKSLTIHGLQSIWRHYKETTLGTDEPWDILHFWIHQSWMKHHKTMLYKMIPKTIHVSFVLFYSCRYHLFEHIMQMSLSLFLIIRVTNSPTSVNLVNMNLNIESLALSCLIGF